MRLNGITAKPGTIIGIDFRSKRFLAVAGDGPKGAQGTLPLRFAYSDEVRPQSFKHEPRSIAEHQGIPRRASVYGMIRQFKPTPTKVVKIELPMGQNLSRRTRRAIRFNRFH